MAACTAGFCWDSKPSNQQTKFLVQFLALESKKIRICYLFGKQHDRMFETTFENTLKRSLIVKESKVRLIVKIRSYFYFTVMAISTVQYHTEMEDFKNKLNRNEVKELLKTLKQLKYYLDKGRKKFQ